MESPTKTTKPLAERDVNSPVSPQKVSPQKQIVEKKLQSKSLEEGSKPAPGFLMAADKGHAASGTYISPSDAIMSPASQKLAGMKGRRFASAKPKSLFAKMTASKLKEQQQVQPVQGVREEKVSDSQKEETTHE